jgi:hypothetical protein
MMETTVYIKRDNQTPVPVRLVTVRRDGNWLAYAEIRTRTGPIKLTAMASEKTVADLVQRGMAKIPAEMTASGADIFSSIAKLAQSQAARNALKQAQSVVTNPLFASALSFIPGFGPAMATVTKASSAIKAAENLLGRARGGDQKAQKSVGVIAQAAQKGSRKGSVLFALLQAADGVRRMLTSGEGEIEVGDVLNELQQTGAVPWTPPWSSGVGSSWTPPWNATGSSWTPPWDASAPPGGVLQGLPPLPPPSPSPPAGAPPPQQQWTAPPAWAPPSPPQQQWTAPQQAPESPQMPSWPQQWPNMPMQMSQGMAPPWPWFPRSTPKC